MFLSIGYQPIYLTLDAHRKFREATLMFVQRFLKLGGNLTINRPFLTKYPQNIVRVFILW